MKCYQAAASIANLKRLLLKDCMAQMVWDHAHSREGASSGLLAQGHLPDPMKFSAILCGTLLRLCIHHAICVCICTSFINLSAGSPIAMYTLENLPRPCREFLKP